MPPSHTPLSHYVIAGLAIATVGGLASTGLLWQKVTTMQEQLARQAANNGEQATQARSVANKAQDQVRDAAARLAVAENRLNEVTLQRGQLDELIQSVSRSRDENLAVDIESAIRVAQQQSQLTGRTDTLVATLKTAQQRIERSAQPRLIPVQRAITKDIERLSTTTVTDIAGLLARLDEITLQINQLPPINTLAPATTAAKAAVNAPAARPAPAATTSGTRKPSSTAATAAAATEQPWWETWPQIMASAITQEVRNLVRIRNIAHPEAVLMTPEQNYFLRENLKLQLLNARMGLLSQHMSSSKADLAAVEKAINTYFDPASRRTQTTLSLVREAQSNIKVVQLPHLDDTLAALSTAAAGR